MLGLQQAQFKPASLVICRTDETQASSNPTGHPDCSTKVLSCAALTERLALLMSMVPHKHSRAHEEEYSSRSDM